VNISVIIPANNSEKTITLCLEDVYKSHGVHFEVIVVDCGSKDLTVSRASKYAVRLIQAGEGTEKGSARNKGAEAAKGDTLVFIDADILIQPDSLKKIYGIMNARIDIDAVTGLLAKITIDGNFFTRYKNLYMNYRFKKMPDIVDFLFTSIAAVRRAAFVPFSDELKPKDTEVGQKLAKMEGRKIFFDRTLEVIHIKEYDFAKIIKNDFIVPFGWAKIFWKYKGWKDVFKEKRYAHSSIDQIASVVCVFIIFISLVLGVMFSKSNFLITFIGLMAFILLNSDFFKFIQKEGNNTFLLKAIIFTFIDNLVMALGIGAGFFTASIERFKSFRRDSD